MLATSVLDICTAIGVIISAVGVVIVNVITTLQRRDTAAMHACLDNVAVKVGDVHAAVSTPPNKATLGIVATDTADVLEAVADTVNRKTST